MGSMSHTMILPNQKNQQKQTKLKLCIAFVCSFSFKRAFVSGSLSDRSHRTRFGNQQSTWTLCAELFAAVLGENHLHSICVPGPLQMISISWSLQGSTHHWTWVVLYQNKNAVDQKTVHLAQNICLQSFKSVCVHYTEKGIICHMSYATLIVSLPSFWKDPTHSGIVSKMQIHH